MAGIVEQPLDQGGEVTITWDKQESNAVVPGTYLPQYLPPAPYLSQQPEDIKRRRNQAKDPQFLSAIEKNLEKKKQALSALTKEHNANPHSRLIRDQVAQLQNNI